MPETNPFPGFTEIKQRARKGPVSLFTLRRWIREGLLPAYKFGRAVYIKDEDYVPQPMKQPKRRTNGK